MQTGFGLSIHPHAEWPATCHGAGGFWRPPNTGQVPTVLPAGPSLPGQLSRGSPHGCSDAGAQVPPPVSGCTKVTPAPSPVLCCHVSAVRLFNCRESAMRAGAVPALSPELRRVSSRGNSRDYVLREKTFSFSVFLPPAHCWQNYLSTTTNPGPACNARKLLWLLVIKFPSAHFVFNTLPNPGLTSSPKHQRGSEFQWLRMKTNVELHQCYGTAWMEGRLGEGGYVSMVELLCCSPGTTAACSSAIHQHKIQSYKKGVGSDSSATTY